ncbi:RNA polymerase recycling motor ATPase HelR [Luteimicrobium subarcticum]|uniref:DNA helicase IV n=1 Tax=Luteimicrobium subarcticum TaxID=620910 RepID=A0A2M8WJV4_9MICO|nr:RNA polymerase recycling motor ATPase HelR [Luteimicrobium subarcticum]PJI91176.1 DNA helicase IV [Luteimicrobium subarcticum]
MPDVFALPARLAAKADPTLIATDSAHLAAVAASLDAQVADVSRRLAEARRAPGRSGTAALERDQEIHRLAARLAVLQRYGIDLCLGRMTPADGSAPVYVGRVGLTDRDGTPLLVDWRSPAAAPFFAATLAQPAGLLSRRRYRWTRGRVTDYWDEVFDPAAAASSSATLDDQSAFVASLAADRSPRMRDVLGTIQADQDVIIRAGSRGVLVVDGGPGTGKTVVALHRAAYLLYADPRLGRGRGDVLVVGPSRPYLDYVSDVLPSLGEEGVRTCTLRDLVPEGADARPEVDGTVAALKGTAAMVGAIETAVRFYEQPPTEALTVETPWDDVVVTVDDWAAAFEAPEPGTPHHEAREAVHEALVTLLVERHGPDGPADGTDGTVDELRRTLLRHRGLTRALHRAWPTLDPGELVGDLWTVPAFMRLCAPWLTPDEARALRRADPAAWTVADLPLLDAARRRLGDPDAERRKHERETAEADARARMTDVVTDLVAADDSDLMIMSMLRGEDLRSALVDVDTVPEPTPDALAGPFAHVVVDEAQELTDAEWQMVLTRCPSRSLTVVGDRAQARRGFAEGWEERMERVGLGTATLAGLTVNYRTPQEVMAVAAPVVRAVLPDANVPTSVRSSGLPVRYGSTATLDDVVAGWLATHDEGVACVVGAPAFPDGERVRSLAPETTKGLEFDLVVLVEPDSWGDGTQGAVDRYVAMTRTTRELVVLTG